jgi:endonuclease G
MKNVLVFLFLLPGIIYGQKKQKDYQVPQKWDTVISNEAYVSFHSQKFESPVAVLYKLYKGGGPCSRAGFRFINDLNVVTATADDYAKSGYDKGHMANAEDFASVCKYDELTFRFYNCAPQRPELNRGPWRMLESKIRELSQEDSILVFCINVYGDTSMHLGNSKALAPTICIKGAKSMKDNKWYVLDAFTNSKEPTQTPVSDPKLIEKEYGIKIQELEHLFRLKRKL